MIHRLVLYIAIAAGISAFAYLMTTRHPDCHPIPPPTGCIQSLHSACDNSCHESMTPDDYPRRWSKP